MQKPEDKASIAAQDVEIATDGSDNTFKPQDIAEGCLVMVSGYQMTATDLVQVVKDGKLCIQFAGKCTDNPANDSIRGTGYDGGTYGGSTEVYTWNHDATPKRDVYAVRVQDNHGLTTTHFSSRTLAQAFADAEMRSEGVTSAIVDGTGNVADQ